MSELHLRPKWSDPSLFRAQRAENDLRTEREANTKLRIEIIKLQKDLEAKKRELEAKTIELAEAKVRLASLAEDFSEGLKVARDLLQRTGLQ